MADLEITKSEDQTKGRYLFNVRVYAVEGRIEFPIAIQDLGSAGLDETAVLWSALGFAEELAALIRVRLGVELRNPEALRKSA